MDQPRNWDLGALLPRFRNRVLGSGKPLPRVERHTAALLFVDITSFTRITQDAIRDGSLETEELARLVESCLGRIARLTEQKGGEVVCFAGDAVWSVWFVNDTLSARDATLLAAETALDVFQRDRQEAPDPRIRLRASIGVGNLAHFELGGHLDEWHPLLSGDAVLDVAGVDAVGAAGRITLSPAAWARISGNCVGAVLDGGFVRLERIRSPGPHPGAIAMEDFVPVARIRANVPRTILDRLDMGISISRTSAFRNATALFVSLGRQAGFSETALKQLQLAIVAAQQAAERFGGCVHQTRTDEKGIVVVLIFGLPPSHHEDHPARAVRAALALEPQFAALGLSISMGIASGRIFSSVVKGDYRQQFTLLGSALNIAAKLMALRDGILVERGVLTLAQRHTRFQSRPKRHLILDNTPTPVEVDSVFDVSTAGQESTAEHEISLIGRESEIKALSGAIDRLRSGIGGVYVIEGAPGIGKTTLVERVVGNAAAMNVHCLVAQADEIEQETPFQVWKGIVEDILSDQQVAVATTDFDRAAQSLLGSTVPNPALPNFVPLPAPEDGAATAKTGDQFQAMAMRQLVVDLLTRLGSKRPTLLVIEDVHWLDASSWGTLNKLAEAGLPLLVLVTVRPEAPMGEPLGHLRESPGCVYIKLNPLSAADSSLLAAGILGVEALDESVSTIVNGRALGNPLFIEQLTKVLSESGMIGVAGTVARLAVPQTDAHSRLDELLLKHGVPPSLEGIILSRLDRLSPELQIAVQAASVVGGASDRPTLEAAVKALGADPMLVPRVEELIRSTVSGLASDSTGSNTDFRHSVLRDVAYNSMSLATRVNVHRAVATAIENSPAGREGRADSVIAYHFKAGAEPRRAIRYFVAAGHKAVRLHTYREAERLLSEALALQAALATAEGAQARHYQDPIFMGNAQLALGRACMRLSKYESTRTHTPAGLRQLGITLPGTTGAATAMLLYELVRQAAHRRALPFFLGRKMRERERLLEAAAGIEDVVEAYFFLGQGIHAVLGAVKMVNLAEIAGYSSFLGRGYAALATLSSFVGARGLARRYATRSLASADRDDATGTAYIFMVVGILYYSLGNWQSSLDLLREGEQICWSIGDTKRWRDFRKTQGQVAGCRGDWHKGLELAASLRDSGETDKDQRYVVSAFRQQAYFFLQLGKLSEVDQALQLLAAEVQRGLITDVEATMQELHGFAATLAWERGDRSTSLREAERSLAVVESSAVTVTMPSTYWSTFLVARIFLMTWREARGIDPATAALAVTGADRSCRALARHARAHPIARAASLLAAGASQELRGRRRRAIAHVTAALQAARELDMPYEAALAEDALRSLGATAAGDRDEASSTWWHEHVQGLPFAFSSVGSNPLAAPA